MSSRGSEPAETTLEDRELAFCSSAAAGTEEIQDRVAAPAVDGTEWTDPEHLPNLGRHRRGQLPEESRVNFALKINR